MIASIRGTLLAAGTDHLVIETGGVGFQIFAPRPVLGAISEIGTEVHLYTHLHIREDLLALYGFTSIEQRTLFELLLTVSGIGPKVALSILSTTTPDELRAAIASGDATRLARIPGIGKKTAERLILELRGKIDLKGITPNAALPPGILTLNTQLAEMLTSLGFSTSEASAALAALPTDAPTDLEERLRLALRYFADI